MALKLDEKQTAVAVGTFAALLHAIWAIAVKLGYGQMLVDNCMAFHGIANGITVETMTPLAGLKLVVVAFIGFAILGWLFAKVWNWAATQKYF